MNKYMTKPDITQYLGIEVTKDTKLEFEKENYKQTIKNLTMKTIQKIEGDGFTSEYKTIVKLNEGDRLIFEEDGRGYIKPVEDMITIEEAIEELKCIKEE